MTKSQTSAVKKKKNLPLVSIVIPNFNSIDLVVKSLQSVLKTDYPNFEIIIVDDKSSDGSYELVLEHFSSNPRIRIIRNTKNFGPAKTRNYGIEESLGKYIAFVETDMEVDPSWLTPLVRALQEDNRLGAVQSKTLDINLRDKIHSLGAQYNPHTFWVISPGVGFDKDWKAPQFYPGIGAVGSLVRKSVINKIGGFDEKIVHNIDDIELGWRIWLAGYNVKTIRESITYHWTAKAANVRAKVTPKLASAFHFFKGHRIILKNYEIQNVLYYLPWQILAYTVLVMKNLLGGNTIPAQAYLKALIWTLVNLNDTLRERRKIQLLRRRSDQEMFKKLAIPTGFFKFYFFILPKTFKWVNQVFIESKDKKFAKADCFVCGYKLQISNDHYSLRADSKSYYKICPACGSGNLLPRWENKKLESLYQKEEYYSGLSAATSNPLWQWLITRRVHQTPSEWLASNFQKSAILDVGCGNGEFLAELQKKGWNVWGIDISEIAVKHTSQRIGAERVKKGEFPQSQFNRQFDLISFWHVLEHLESPQLHLRRAEALLTKKGRVVGEVPNFSSPWLKLFQSGYAWIMVPVHQIYFSKASLIKLLGDCGFKNIKIQTPPRALLNFSLSLDKVLAKKGLLPIGRKLIVLLTIPLSVLFGLILSLAGQGEVLRFVAEKSK